MAIEIREEPDSVIGLYERWLDMSRARYVISPQAWIGFEEVVGKFEDVTALLARVRELAKAAGTGANAEVASQATSLDAAREPAGEWG